MSVSIDLAGVECNLVAPVRRGDYQRASGDSGYHRYAWVLKWLTVSLLAYPITAFFQVIIAGIGTTITRYRCSGRLPGK